MVYRLAIFSIIGLQWDRYQIIWTGSTGISSRRCRATGGFRWPNSRQKSGCRRRRCRRASGGWRRTATSAAIRRHRPRENGRRPRRLRAGEALRHAIGCARRLQPRGAKRGRNRAVPHDGVELRLSAEGPHHRYRAPIAAYSASASRPCPMSRRHRPSWPWRRSRTGSVDDQFASVFRNAISCCRSRSDSVSGCSSDSPKGAAGARA